MALTPEQKQQILADPAFQKLKGQPVQPAPTGPRTSLIERARQFREGAPEAPRPRFGLPKEIPEQKGVEEAQSFFKGFGKDVARTVAGMSQLGLRALQKITGVKAQGEPIEKLEKVQEELEPEGGFEEAGAGVSQIAQFLAPGGAPAKLAAKASKFGKAAQAGARVATEAGLVGSQVALREGEVNERTKTAALVGGVFGGLVSALKGVKAFAKPVGEKIQATIIRPTIRDTKDGFKIANIDKFNVGGTLEETATKVHTRLNALGRELKKKLKSSDAKVNLNDSFRQAEKELLGADKAKQFGDIQATGRVLGNLKDEIKEVAARGLVNLVDATSVKRGAGTKGAWAFGRVEPDATAVEKVYTTFYRKLRENIEKTAPDGLKGINKQISELIPISNAVIRRLPVEQRNNVISLTDSIGLFASVFDPRALALIGASRLSKSGKFGQFLINLSKKTSKTPIGKRILGK